MKMRKPINKVVDGLEKDAGGLEKDAEGLEKDVGGLKKDVGIEKIKRTLSKKMWKPINVEVEANQ